ncbi:uncharacterized protein [Nicotiana tomentosiformis]|uniref:uncharacterized protein n=1 Tax=Nicotiana tomentosiformis TaxID=4098 RepID=UPI00388C9944
MVKWIKTPVLSVKLNSNGSCVEGKCGGEGIIRDYQGFTIFAYSMQLGPGTSNIAEAAALLFAREWKSPWKIEKYVREIQKLVEEHGFTIFHCYREANKPADKLAAISHFRKGTHIFNSFFDLPNQVKGLVNRTDAGSNRQKHPSLYMIHHELFCQLENLESSEAYFWLGQTLVVSSR